MAATGHVGPPGAMAEAMEVRRRQIEKYSANCITQGGRQGMEGEGMMAAGEEMERTFPFTSVLTGLSFERIALRSTSKRPLRLEQEMRT
jgi:hypothetical protein